MMNSFITGQSIKRILKDKINIFYSQVIKKVIILIMKFPDKGSLHDAY